MISIRTLDERAFAQGLLRLARIYRREVNRALAAHGISDAKAMPVLHIARAGGGMRQGMLAEEIGVEGPSLVRILDQLSQAGLVERRDDPSDKRAKTLHLTSEGQALAAVVEVARGHANLEYDLARGARGHRHDHAVELIRALRAARPRLSAGGR